MSCFLLFKESSLPIDLFIYFSQFVTERNIMLNMWIFYSSFSLL